MAKLDMKHRPDAEYRYWLFDPLGDGMMYFNSRKERDAHAQICIDEYQYGGIWGDEVEGVCAGEVTNIASLRDKRMRPEDCDIDEDGFDKDREMWLDGAEWHGRYTLVPIAAETDIGQLRKELEIENLCQECDHGIRGGKPCQSCGGNGERTGT